MELVGEYDLSKISEYLVPLCFCNYALNDDDDLVFFRSECYGVVKRDGTFTIKFSPGMAMFHYYKGYVFGRSYDGNIGKYDLSGREKPVLKKSTLIDGDTGVVTRSFHDRLFFLFRNEEGEHFSELNPETLDLVNVRKINDGDIEMTNDVHRQKDGIVTFSSFRVHKDGEIEFGEFPTDGSLASLNFFRNDGKIIHSSSGRSYMIYEYCLKDIDTGMRYKFEPGAKFFKQDLMFLTDNVSKVRVYKL